MSKFKKVIIWFFVFLVLCAAGAFAIYKWSYSSGKRTGRLVKLSQKGVLFKEWDGQLDLGSGDNLIWSFSVRDDDLGLELSKLMGENVILTYKRHLFRFIYSTKYDVSNFRLKEINKAKVCPFLYLLRSNKGLQEQAADVIASQREDLREEIDNCLRRLEKFSD